MPSAAVFPGTVQCPEDGQPYLLSVDAQTTGGYPRVAQIIRADRHLLGQIRPGDKLRLLLRDEAGANHDLRAKIHYWEEWLPNVAQVM
jgi:allophanate hydrolase subunit 2